MTPKGQAPTESQATAVGNCAVSERASLANSRVLFVRHFEGAACSNKVAPQLGQILHALRKQDKSSIFPLTYFLTW